MLDDPSVKVLPPFVRGENRCSPQEWSIQSFNARPSHELACHEAFDKIAVAQSGHPCRVRRRKLTSGVPALSGQGLQTGGAACLIVHCYGMPRRRSRLCVPRP